MSSGEVPTPQTSPEPIGPPLDRVEGPLKVSGQARYSYEYRGSQQTIYGFFVGSSIPKGTITSIDISAAEHEPGVLAVLTYQNAPKQAPPHPRVSEVRFDRAEPFLFAPDVRYFGEPVALVLATSFETARHAASLIRVSYDRAADVVLDLDASLSRAYKPERANAGAKTETQEGNLEEAFTKAPVKVDATYVVPYEHNMPMEPHATVATWHGDRVTLFSGQQIPKWAQSSVARTFKIQKENVRIITPYIGGAFGSKIPTHAQAILAALGAKAIGRPVKIAQTRPQMFANTNHRPRGIQRMRLGAERDGALTAISHEVWMQTTPYDEFIEQAAAYSRVMYAAPNRLHRHWGVALDLPSSDIMRAPGEEPGSIATECAMDELAHALSMDPIALRIKNEPHDDPETHLPFSTRGVVRCLQEGARRFDWQKRPTQPASLREGRLLIGYGVACGMFPTRMNPSSALVRIEPDGRILARMSATDLGTGTYTVLTQIAAERLGVPLESVTVEIGDTAFPPAAGSGGSMGAASAGTALQMACDELREKLQARPASESLAAFVKRTAPEGLEARAEHQGSPKEPKYSIHAYGAQFVQVAVDRYTGEVRLRRMLGVFACGRILNAKTARSQLVGSMIMGVGAALTEESVLDLRDGSFVNHDLAEYHVPVNADIGEIDAIFIPERDDQANPLGIKGLGEVGIVGAAAAVGNAVFNATGVRVRDFPITLDKLLRHLPADAQV